MALTRFALLSQFDSEFLKTIQDLLHRTLDLLILERLVLVTEYQAVCHRLISVRNAGSLVDVKEPVALEDLASAL